ncbi:hypothetical protein KAR91_23560 [Candidatus Pacearchaeota archaeon]|nr:hypothetical protein [Candidatus Pacearchaeota archaeon]
MKDSADNRYIEKSIPNGNVRVTYVDQGWDNTPSVRLQIRESNGHLRQGPEIPIASVGELVGAIVELLAGTD